MRGRGHGEVNLDVLADLCQGLEVELPAPVPEHTRRLMDTLGVTIKEVSPMEMSADRLGRSYDCAMAGCDGECYRDRGPFARLCDDHKAELLRLGQLTLADGSVRYAPSRGGLGRGEPEPTTDQTQAVASKTERVQEKKQAPTSGPMGLAAAARAIVPLASKLEKAMATKRAARDQANETALEFDRALKALRDAAQAVISG